MKKIKLLQVTEANNNKFYDMEQVSATEFVATYGRVNKTSATERYPMSKWESKYREKLKKGYTDVTDLYVVNEAKDASLTSDETLNEILRYLVNVSRTSFGVTYAKGANVTKAQVNAAQAILNEIAVVQTLEEARKQFLALYTTIPRQMSNVTWYLPKSLEEVKEYLEKEQATLDNAAIQTSFSSTSGENLLEKLGVTMRLTSLSDDIQEILQGNGTRVKRVIDLRKPNIDELFETHLTNASNPKRILAWHGTSEENVLSICSLSLLVRPTSIANGSMLGVAAYISQEFQKSYNYTRGKRKFMFVFEAHVGRELVADTQSKIKPYTLAELEKLGFDSVYAPAGSATGWTKLRFSERTIYRSEQLRPRYLLEVA